MWRLWDMDSLEEQQWDNSNDASEGIPVLARWQWWECNICWWKCLCHLYRVPMLLPGLQPMPCLPFQVQPVTLLHPLVNINWLFYSNLINIFHLKPCCYFACVRSQHIYAYCLCFFLNCFFIESLPNIISETASSCHEVQQTDERRHMEKEVWRKYLNLCELYIFCFLNISFV